MEFYPLSKQEINSLPPNAFIQVSQLIENYVAQHSGEMLIKTPEQIETTYRQGNSVIAIHPEDPNLVLGYAALYPFNLKNAFGIELYEFGSWIVHPDFRHHRINGLTIGEYIGQNLIINKDEPIIATVKRLNTLRAFEKLGFQPIKFQDDPVISTLTCTCPTSSEHHGFSTCQHRSQNPGEIIKRNGPNEPPKIACTLVGYNLDQLNELEKKLQQQLGLAGQVLNSDFFQKARLEFEKLGIKIL